MGDLTAKVATDTRTRYTAAVGIFSLSIGKVSAANYDNT